jgi:hypothetical protein
MRKFSFKFLAALALCGAMATGTAWAKDHIHGNGGKANGRDRGHHERAMSEHRQGKPAVLGTAPSQRPPGWDHGKKTGWGNCDVPPGQAKKAGCQSVRARRAKRRAERRDVRRREEARQAQRRQQRHAARQQAQQRRAQVIAARHNARTPAPHHDGKRDRD